MATPQELQRLIQELESKINNLAPNNAGFRQMLDNLRQSAQNTSQIDQNLDAARQLLITVNREIQEINDELGYTFKSFQAIINELTKGQANVGNINKGVKSLTDAAQKLVNRQAEYGRMTAKELKKLKDQTYITFDNLRAEREILKQRLQQRNLSDKQRAADEARLGELNGILKASYGLEASFKRQIEYAIEEQKAIENSLGLAGGLIKAFSTLPGLGSISQYLKVDEATESMEKYSAKILEAVKDSEAFAPEFTRLNVAIQNAGDAISRIDEALENQNLTAARRAELEQDRLNVTKKLNDLTVERAELEAEAAKTIDSFIGKVAVGIVGVQNLARGFAKAILDPAVIFTTLMKGMGQVSKETTTFQRSLGISAESAKDILDRFEVYSAFQKDTYFTTTKLVAAQQAYNEALGFSGRIIEANAKAQVKMTDMMGVSVEASNQLRFFAESTGQDLNQQLNNQKLITKQVSAQYGVSLQAKNVLETTAKASSYTRMQFKGSTEALTAAVAEAKALGTTIESTGKSAKALMQFETSIQNELEAELLTGRQLNLEQARYYALTNNIAGLTRELVREAGNYSEFMGMNAIQQESLANALGKDVSELSDILFMEQFRNMTRDEALAQLDDEGKKRYEALDIQQRFNGLVEKLQRMLVDIADGPLFTIVELFADLLSSATGMGAVIGLMAGSQLINMALSAQRIARSFRAMAVASRSTAIANAVASAVQNPFKALAGIALAGGIAASVGALIGNITEGDDVFSPAPGGGGYGKRVLLGPEGAFSLNNRDNILATTNPIPVNDMMIRNNTSSGPMQPIQVVVSSMLDGQLVGQGMELAKYKTSS